MSEHRLKFSVIERQVSADSVGSEDAELLDWLADVTERSGSLLDEADETHVVIGVEVRHVDGLQVSKDVERRLAAELSVELKKGALPAVQENEVVLFGLDED